MESVLESNAASQQTASQLLTLAQLQSNRLSMVRKLNSILNNDDEIVDKENTGSVNITVPVTPVGKQQVEMQVIKPSVIATQPEDSNDEVMQEIDAIMDHVSPVAKVAEVKR